MTYDLKKGRITLSIDIDDILADLKNVPPDDICESCPETHVKFDELSDLFDQIMASAVKEDWFWEEFSGQAAAIWKQARSEQTRTVLDDVVDALNGR